MGNPGWKKDNRTLREQDEVGLSEAGSGCGRQARHSQLLAAMGKSTVAAAKAVHRAYSGSLTLLLTRQSGEFIRKAKEFVRRLGIPVKGDGDNKASIAFPNGSRIVGLPESAAKRSTRPRG